jgi:hypothetical protein
MQLVIRDRSKTYPNGPQALKAVSLDVPQGMFGLLGTCRARRTRSDRPLAWPQSFGFHCRPGGRVLRADPNGSLSAE